MRKLELNKIYRHFKGGFYRVIGTALHTETGDTLVLYSPVNDYEQTFARPIEMFLDKVDIEKYPHSFQEYRLMTLDELEESISATELEYVMYGFECAIAEGIKKSEKKIAKLI